MANAEALAEILRQPGSVVCLTGEMQACDRLEAMRIFEAMGLRVSGSVSRHTSFLLAGDNALQEKLDRAAADSVPVFTESEFWAAVALVYPSE